MCQVLEKKSVGKEKVFSQKGREIALCEENCMLKKEVESLEFSREHLEDTLHILQIKYSVLNRIKSDSMDDVVLLELFDELDEKVQVCSRYERELTLCRNHIMAQESFIAAISGYVPDNIHAVFPEKNVGICTNCDECPSFNLCEKRILIVGGVERMETLYRAFVEGNGGFLDYHNGSLQSGCKTLESYLKRADLVLCPVNCNSHNACKVLKKLAKKYGKDFYMIPNGGISTVERIIVEHHVSPHVLGKQGQRIDQ